MVATSKVGKNDCKDNDPLIQKENEGAGTSASSWRIKRRTKYEARKFLKY